MSPRIMRMLDVEFAVADVQKDRPSASTIFGED
jgi:hypothetical protein